MLHERAALFEAGHIEVVLVEKVPNESPHLLVHVRGLPEEGEWAVLDEQNFFEERGTLREKQPKEVDHHELLQQRRHITEDPTRSNSIVHRFVEPEDIGQIQARLAFVARKAALLRHLRTMDRDICLLALRAARQVVFILSMQVLLEQEPTQRFKHVGVVSDLREEVVQGCPHRGSQRGLILQRDVPNRQRELEALDPLQLRHVFWIDEWALLKTFKIRHAEHERAKLKEAQRR